MTQLGVSYVNGERAASMEGIVIIARAISESRTLRELNVSYNSIGPSGGKCLSDAIGSNATLTSLDISGNLIGLKGGKAICDALEANPRFKHADLTSNSLDTPTKELLLETVGKREGLRVLL